MVFDVDLVDKYDEEWLTGTAEAWIQWRTFNTSLTDTIEFIKTTEVTTLENVESIVTITKMLTTYALCSTRISAAAQSSQPK